MSDKDVFRKAPSTPGLLNIVKNMKPGSRNKILDFASQVQQIP